MPVWSKRFLTRRSEGFWCFLICNSVSPNPLNPLASELKSDVRYFVDVQRSWILVVALCLERSLRWGRKLQSLLSSVHMPRGCGCVTISQSLLSDLFVPLVSCTVPVCFCEFCFCLCPDGVQLKLHLLCMPFQAFRFALVSILFLLVSLSPFCFPRLGLEQPKSVISLVCVSLMCVHARACVLMSVMRACGAYACLHMLGLLCTCKSTFPKRL